MTTNSINNLLLITVWYIGETSARGHRLHWRKRAPAFGAHWKHCIVPNWTDPSAVRVASSSTINENCRRRPSQCITSGLKTGGRAPAVPPFIRHWTCVDLLFVRIEAFRPLHAFRPSVGVPFRIIGVFEY